MPEYSLECRDTDRHTGTIGPMEISALVKSLLSEGQLLAAAAEEAGPRRGRADMPAVAGAP